MPKYRYAQHTYTTPVCVGSPTHKRYLLMSPKRTQPQADGAPNIHLCPNTGVLSTPIPLPSMWDTPHPYSTSSCCPSLLNPTWMGHLTYTYMCAQIQVCSAHLHHSRPHGTPITHTVPHHVTPASSFPHGRGTQHTCINIPK